MFTLEQIHAVLRDHQPQQVTPKASTRQAAVAIVMREHTDGPQLLFIKRADKEGDPWSGHMAFPGGLMDRGD